MFDWNDSNIDHVARHGITPEEAEEALLDPHRIGTPARRVGEELRRAMLGATEERRVLFLVYTRRAGRIRIITARDTTDGERRRYRT